MRGHQRPLRILIVSATVGAGDVGNARELARRLSAGGHEVCVRDFLDAPPLGLGRAFTRGYEAELRHAPWAYEAAFKMWFWMPFLLGPMSRLLSWACRRRVSEWARQCNADVVVSTYPIATQVVGDMRRRARRRLGGRRHSLGVPAVNVITDFGYHPFWGHRHIDLNLAVHPGTAEAVAKRTGKPGLTCEPLVAPRFSQAGRRRAEVRRALGLANEQVGVLISSGSWGVGDVTEAFELVARQPGLVPVVACGRNEKLRQELTELAARHAYPGVALGWTEDMAGVMAACDVLVENAGGLTSLEAMAVGLPLVNFRPIPGHGRNSAAVMELAGVSRWAKADGDLVDHLVALGRPTSERRAQLQKAAALFRRDAAQVVTSAAWAGTVERPQLRPVARLVRAASAATLLATLSWVGLTEGVGVAAAAGFGVAHAPAGMITTAFIGARLNAEQLASPAVRDAIAHADASAVLSLGTAETDPGAVRALEEQGIDVESGGLGDPPGGSPEPGAPWGQALADTRSVQVLSVLAQQPIGMVVPDRSVTAFDLVDAGSAHIQVIVPNMVLPAAPSGPYPRPVLAVPVLQGAHIYLVDGTDLTSAQLVEVLDTTALELAQQGIAPAPFSGLQ